MTRWRNRSGWVAAGCGPGVKRELRRLAGVPVAPPRPAAVAVVLVHDVEAVAGRADRGAGAAAVAPQREGFSTGGGRSCARAIAAGGPRSPAPRAAPRRGVRRRPPRRARPRRPAPRERLARVGGRIARSCATRSRAARVKASARWRSQRVQGLPRLGEQLLAPGGHRVREVSEPRQRPGRVLPRLVLRRARERLPVLQERLDRSPRAPSRPATTAAAATGPIERHEEESEPGSKSGPRPTAEQKHELSTPGQAKLTMAVASRRPNHSSSR